MRRLFLKCALRISTLPLLLALILSSSVPLFASSSPGIAGFSASPVAFNSVTGNTTFTYTLSGISSGTVTLEILNGSGSVVRTINAGTQSSGTHTIVWDGKDGSGVAVPEGNYTGRLKVSVGSGNSYSFVTKWGSAGAPCFPFGIALDSEGKIYVADFHNHCIHKLSPDGNILKSWGKFGSMSGEFYNPRGVAIDSLGYIYVVDSNNNRIQKFDSNGNFITKWGSQGSGDGQFKSPYDVAIDSSGYIYVTDQVNRRIQKFDSNGNFITK